MNIRAGIKNQTMMFNGNPTFRERKANNHILEKKYRVNTMGNIIAQRIPSSQGSLFAKKKGNFGLGSFRKSFIIQR